MATEYFWPSDGGGGGTVTSVSVVTANGISGSVANPTTTPAITLTLGAITPSSVAATGTVTGSNLSGTNTGNVTLTAVGAVPNANGASLSGQVLTLQPANTSFPGVLLAADWNTFNNKQSTLTLGNLTDVGTDGIVITGGTGAVIGSGTSIAQQVSDTTHNGYLSSTDWNTFNNKQASGSYITALTGDVTATGPGSVAATLASSISGAKTFSTSLTSVFISLSSNPASSGVLRLANLNAVSWRNAANSADLSLSLDASNIFQFGSAINSSGNVTGANLSGTNTGNVTLTAFGSTPSANAASLSGQALTLQPADGTNPGGVSTGTQTFAGNKTFSGTVAASNLSGTNTGDVTLAAVGSSPSNNAASLSGQVLTLQPFDSTHPGVVSSSGGGTTNFLRADNTWAAPSGGSSNLTVTSQSTTYSILTSDQVVLLDATGAGFTATLPTASGVTGKYYYIQKIVGDTSFNLATIATTGGQTIGGFSSFTLATFGEVIEIVSDGSNWVLTGHQSYTPWTTYSLTIGGSTSAPTKGTTTLDTAQWRRSGDSIQVRYDYIQTAGGANGTGNYLYPIPTGLTADSAKIGAATNGNYPVVGKCQIVQVSIGTAENVQGICQMRNTTQMQLVVFDPGNHGGTDTADFHSSTFLALGSNANLTISYFAEIPITNWLL